MGVIPVTLFFTYICIVHYGDHAVNKAIRHNMSALSSYLAVGFIQIKYMDGFQSASSPNLPQSKCIP